MQIKFDNRYPYRYLKVTERPANMGRVVARVDVNHLNKKGINTEWDRLDLKFPTREYISCFEQTQLEMPCFEKNITKEIES